jgi:hypothetical protein
METDIKFGEMKLLLLYKEWVLLKEFEKHDGVLGEKLAGKQAEKADIDFKVMSKLVNEVYSLFRPFLFRSKIVKRSSPVRSMKWS